MQDKNTTISPLTSSVTVYKSYMLQAFFTPLFRDFAKIVLNSPAVSGGAFRNIEGAPAAARKQARDRRLFRLKPFDETRV